MRLYKRLFLLQRRHSGFGGWWAGDYVLVDFLKGTIKDMAFVDIGHTLGAIQTGQDVTISCVVF